MTSPHPPKVAGINPPVPAPAHTSAPAVPTPPTTPEASSPASGTLFQDRLAGWVSDLTTLHELTERLSRTADLDAALRELLRAGASLVGAGRGLVTLHPDSGTGHPVTVGLGLGHADIGHIETIPPAHAPRTHGPTTNGPPAHSPRTHDPRSPSQYDGQYDGPYLAPDDAGPFGSPYVRLLDDLPPEGDRSGRIHPDIPGEDGLDPRYREVAARLGYAASYALPLESAAGPPSGPDADAPPGAGRVGAAVWLYDEPAEPNERQRHLAGLYCGYAAEHLARLIELTGARDTVAALREELLPSRLPRVPGIRLAVRHRTGPRGGGNWFDALPLPEGALGLAIGGITDSGPGVVAATGRLRASLRAYAVMEGEDPVAVLSDLELLLRLTEPARTATALFAYCEPPGTLPGEGRGRKVVVAGAGHCSPLIVGPGRVEYVETSLSAPLGMLACWEAPSVEIEPEPGETLLFYSDGLLHRTGDSMDRAFARLRSAAATVPRSARRDPEAIADHVLRTVLPEPEGGDPADPAEDVVLLVAHFE
ncbi:serine/threonine-protein phosphatase [Streptomyces luteoverticillatus]|uniref:Serine/threonine-protein phosphatase n=1 Tax=Streptomyces luteoverticillatus TaxID=66425 RepID=A0A3S9PJS7_STRLT|nr:PP2C family protein-serine/threonine phosphatase [Streptomyces luteoverticillatus]AZQ72593.1 serine/threonine-protein phosphatase [Streptomyces luteoverticillatus]